MRGWLYDLRERIDWRWVFAAAFLIYFGLLLFGVIPETPADPGSWGDPDPRER